MIALAAALIVNFISSAERMGISECNLIIGFVGPDSFWYDYYSVD